MHLTWGDLAPLAENRIWFGNAIQNNIFVSRIGAQMVVSIGDWG